MTAGRISRRSLLYRIGAGAALSVVPRMGNASVLSPWADGSHTAGPIRLDRNENPRGPSPRVIAALREAAPQIAHRYAGKQTESLQRRLSDLHGVAPEQIVLGCGSSEVLRGSVDAFAGPQRKVVLGTPTFDLIGRFAEAAGADVAAVPLAANHAHDLDAMAAAADDRTGLVYLCNPNNPTASVTPRKALESFVSRLPTTTRIVIDEAYHHYVGGSSDYASFIERPLVDPRLIVTRSFSAIYGLAGMRVGYAVASPEVAGMLRSRCLPESLTSLAVRAALAALDDVDYIQTTATSNTNGRQEFFNQANARMLRGIDSHANFVMFDTQHDAADVVAHFSRQGILIAGPFHGFPKSVRVSLGTPDDMGEFWRVWDTKYGHAM